MNKTNISQDYNSFFSVEELEQRLEMTVEPIGISDSDLPIDMKVRWLF